MRVYTRACQDKNRDKDKDKIYRALEKIAELSQLGILTFLEAEGVHLTSTTEKKNKRKKPSPKVGCFPPRETLNRIEKTGGQLTILEW